MLMEKINGYRVFHLILIKLTVNELIPSEFQLNKLTNECPRLRIKYFQLMGIHQNHLERILFLRKLYQKLLGYFGNVTIT